MAYKFQVGVAQLSGNLTQEGALTAEGLASLDGGIDVNGANFTVSTAGALSAAGLANLDGGIEVDNGGNKFTVSTAGAVVAEGSVSGAAGTFDTLAGTSLALQNGGISAAGAIAGASTITATGLVSSSAPLNGLSLDINSAASVNSAGAASFASANLNAGGISNAGAIVGATTISGSSTISGLELDIEKSANIAQAADIGGKLTVVGVSDLDGGIDVNGSNFTVAATGFLASPSGSITDLFVGDDAQFADTVTIEGVLRADAAATFATTVAVNGLSNLDGGIEVDNGGNKFTVSTAGAVVAEGSVSGAAGTFDTLAGTSLALQNGGISAAGAIAGASTITATGLVSSSAKVEALELEINSGLTINSGGAIAGASTIAASGLANLDGGIEIDNSGNKFTVSTAGVVVAAGLANLDGGIDVNGSNFTVATNGHLVSPSGSIADLYVSDDAHFADTVLIQGALSQTGNATFTGAVSSSQGLHITAGLGLIVGASGELQVTPNGNVSTSGDVTGSAFDFAKGADFKIAQSLLPDVASSLDLGSSALPYQAVYADTFIGNIAFDTQTVTDFGPVAAASDIVYVNMASTGLTLELPTGSAGKVLRIKASGERPFEISGAAGTGDSVFDQPADSILVKIEQLGAAMTCVYSGSAGSGKWHII